MSSPLIARLFDEYKYPRITAENHEAFVQGDKTAVLFFVGNTKRFPESLDVAVVLPELVSAFDSTLRPGVVLEEDEEVLKRHYAFSIWPALVFVRQGITLGAICKVQDWHDYLSQINQLMNASSHINNIIPTVEVDHGRA